MISFWIISILFLINIVVIKGEGLGWSNWDLKQTCKILDYSVPETEGEIIKIILDANMNGEKVKVVGAGHSFSQIALTSGHMISLDKMNKILRVNGTYVTVQGGIRLHELNEQLE